MSVADRLAAVHARIERACEACGRDPAEVELLAVSKTHDAEMVREAYAAGQQAFGENKVQELAAKAGELTDLPLRWHAIGPIQTNKVRQLVVVPGLALLHTVDRPKLVHRLAAVLEEVDGSLDVLLQIAATGEETKHGVTPDQAAALAELVQEHAARLRLRGLMAMGPLEGDPVPVFTEVARLREALRDQLGLPLPVFSLGMTGDLEQAVAAGSTLLRVGTAVFGEREY